MFRKSLLLLVALSVLASFVPTIKAEQRDPSQAVEAVRPWTLEEAVAQWQLYPQDPYLQYVALQLARREGDAELKRVARLIAPRDRQAGRRGRPGRAERVNLFSMTSGALAVQESLQLDAMVDGETAVESVRVETNPAQFQGPANTRQNLMQLGLAFHNFHAAHRQLPRPASYDAQGAPLLSWRVHILPFLGQGSLYRRFHLDEPWDSPHNKQLISRIPNIYRTFNAVDDQEHKTCFLVPVGEATIFAGKGRARFADVKDGLSNTIMLVEAAASQAVIWTKPEDLKIDVETPVSGLAGIKHGWLHVVLGDGSVRSIPSTVDPQVLMTLYTRSKAELIDWSNVYARLPSGVTAHQTATMPISQLEGPTIKSHPFQQMLEGREPAISSLAMAVPEDFYYIRFRQSSKLLELADQADIWAAHLFSQSVHQACSHRTVERLKTQLCIATNPLLQPFYDLAVNEVVITGSDLYFREGSDITLLFRYVNDAVFRRQMDQFLVNAAKEGEHVKQSEGSHRGVPFVHLTTHDRRIHLFSAYPEPGLHVRSNSRLTLERIIDTLKSSASEADVDVSRALGNTAEFQYMRTLFEKDAGEEDGFIYLSDPFIRKQVGPVKKITERRRLLCYNHLRMLGHAALLYRTEQGIPARSISQLLETRCLPLEFGQGKLACPDGGTYQLSEDGREGVCDVHGRVGYLNPCCEIAATHIPQSEQSLYQDFLNEYNSYWRTFFDPIGVRIQTAPDVYRVETIVLPLIENSVYSATADILSGEPVFLDRLPVASRDIFSLAAKFDKSQFVQAEGKETPPQDVANDLKQIGLAFHNYHDTVHKRFPPAQEQNAGLSWRVHLLPFLEQGALYGQFHLDEPWNSPHNKTLLESMPAIYGATGSKTRIVGFAGKDAPMGRTKGLRLGDVLDGTSNTLLVVRAGVDCAVEWTKPEDLAFAADDPWKSLGQVDAEGVSAVMMDGSVHLLSRDMEADTLRKLITYRGGEAVQFSNPDARRRSRSMLNMRHIERALVEMGATEEDVEQLKIGELLARGIGEELSFHICDSEPTFSFSVPRFFGTVMSLNRNRIDGEVLIPLLLVSSLDAPVYMTLPVADADIVDGFLERLDDLLAKVSRAPIGGSFFSLETDFYQLSSVDQQVRCFAIGGFGFRFRFFAKRIDDALYISTQPFVLSDLMQQRATESTAEREDQGDTFAHLLIRIRPQNWGSVLDDYRLGWAEGNRRSCLRNLGPLSGLARAYNLPADQLVDLAEELYGVRYFCPEGGAYERSTADSQSSPDAAHDVSCTVHGTAAAPRQRSAPVPGSQLDQLLSEFQGLTAALTFTEEGLRAVLRIDRTSASPTKVNRGTD